MNCVNPSNWGQFTRKLGAIFVLAGAISVTTATLAEPLDPVYMERYGGTYARNCSDAASERVSVHENQLIFTDGKREWVASDMLPNVFYWGRMPPEDFEIALLARNPQAASMIVLIYRDEDGLYLVFEGGAPNTDNDTDDDIRYLGSEMISDPNSDPSTGAAKPLCRGQPLLLEPSIQVLCKEAMHQESLTEIPGPHEV